MVILPDAKLRKIICSILIILLSWDTRNIAAASVKGPVLLDFSWVAFFWIALSYKSFFFLLETVELLSIYWFIFNKYCLKTCRKAGTGLLEIWHEADQATCSLKSLGILWRGWPLTGWLQKMLESWWKRHLTQLWGCTWGTWEGLSEEAVSKMSADGWVEVRQPWGN